MRRTLLAAALVVAACGPSEPDPYGGPVRTVVVISLDTLRADHLGCYGRQPSLTPAIDALAAEGVRFTDALTAAPTTLASHVSLMTGTYPHTHGTPRNGFTVLPENRMLAELLQERGFETAAFLGSWALDAAFGFDQGFGRFDAEFDVVAGPVRPAEPGGEVELIEQSQRRAESVNRAVFRYLDETHDGRDARRFLFVHYFDAHAPYDAPAPFGREGGEGSTLGDLKRAVLEHQARFVPEPPGFDGTIVTGIPREVLDGADGSELPIDARLKDDYAREVRYLDHHVGRLLDGLRERGVLERAIVVLTADHGESFHEHGDFWNHGSWVYDTTAHVPLVIWRSLELAPDARPAAVTTPVSTIDIVPTLLELLELDVPPAVEGVSLAPALAGEPLERGPVFCEATQPTHPELEPAAWTNARKARCVREGGWKLIHSPLHGRLELFDVAGDSGERTNRSTDRVCDERRFELQETLNAWDREARPTRSTYNAAQDETLLQRMIDYGYTGAGAEDGADAPR